MDVEARWRKRARERERKREREIVQHINSECSKLEKRNARASNPRGEWDSLEIMQVICLNKNLFWETGIKIFFGNL